MNGFAKADILTLVENRVKTVLAIIWGLNLVRSACSLTGFCPLTRVNAVMKYSHKNRYRHFYDRIQKRLNTSLCITEFKIRWISVDCFLSSLSQVIISIISFLDSKLTKDSLLCRPARRVGVDILFTVVGVLVRVLVGVGVTPITKGPPAQFFLGGMCFVPQVIGF